MILEPCCGSRPRTALELMATADAEGLLSDRRGASGAGSAAATFPDCANPG